MKTHTTTPAPPAAVQAVIDAYPANARTLLLSVRDLILDTASRQPDIGAITETLKWGEPGFLTEATKSGTTIRLAWSPKRPDHLGLFVSCQTTLLDDWRVHYADTLSLIGNRELRLPLNTSLPIDAVSHCIAMALTYHSRKTPS